MNQYLHGGVINNHAIKLNVGVTRGHLLAALQKQPIPQLPVRKRK